MRFDTPLSQIRLIAVWISLLLFTPIAWAQLSSISTPEHVIRAARFDDIKGITNYAEQQGDINLTEVDRGESLLMISVRENSHRVFAYLLQNPKIQLDQRAKNGDTALMLAAYLEQKDKVQQLIEAGAKVNQDGWTALHYATVVGNLEIVTMLIERHADINAETPNKTSPLMLAARRGEMSVVKLLIAGGADITLKNMHGWTARDFALESERRDIAALLLELMQAKFEERK